MLLELLRQRRSIRRFSSQPIEKEKRESLIETMLRSPSSRSLNPWDFLVVDERDLLKKLSQAKPHGAAFMRDASLAIVICGDPDKCDVWIEDCSIASLLLHLAAEDLGLGSCWVQIRKREHDGSHSAGDYVRRLLSIPENLEVEAIVAIGYPAEQKEGHSRESLLWERVHHNRYGEKTR